MSGEYSIIVFNASKKEAGNPSTNIKKIIKKYKETYQCGRNIEDFTQDRLKMASLVIFFCPKEMSTREEFDALKQYLESGGRVLVLSSEGGGHKNRTNINFFLEQYGISINNDCVVRTAFYKYFHPKETYVHSGILNEEVTRVANGLPKETKRPQNTFLQNVIGKDDEEDEYQKEQSRVGLDFVYAFGATLTVQQPAHAILGSGPLSYPSNRPVSAIVQTKNNGRLAVIGSFEMFTDEYFDNEDNSKIFDFFIKYLLTNECEFEFSPKEPDVEYFKVPDIAELADNLKSCLQESDPLPFDSKQLFMTDLFKYDVDLVPEAVKLYETLGVKHDPLALIVPQFETPLLGLVSAVFPPILKELAPPSLELFDLDDEFASEKVRLAQLTNKCNNSELDYYIKESGDILGVTDKVKNKHDAKAILRYVLEELINFKKLNN
uniref:Raft-like protein n=1 Tax=Tetrahymena thermophila TaxID=5911 RepID=Q8WQJ4_TETTH|nr:raft-like protein [Tetrahymena thermophila]